MAVLNIRNKDDPTEGANEIHEFWDGKITSAMEAEWRSLGFSMFQSFPPVKAMHIHCAHQSNPDDDEAQLDDDGNSEFTKYLHRPAELDGPIAPYIEQDMPTALDYFERVSVVTKPPAAVRAAVGRAQGSINDVLHTANWPVQRSSGSPIFCSVINDRPYYYYLRGFDDRCVVRAHHARYRTEQWYLRLIAMKVPIAPFHATSNPDPLRNLLTVTKDGTSVVHTTYQETARALGIINNDNEGELALIEASSYATPESLLSLFAQVTINGQPTLRILCGLGLSLSTPKRGTLSKSSRDDDDDGDCDDRSSPFDLDADSNNDDDSDTHSEGAGLSDFDGASGDLADSDSAPEDEHNDGVNGAQPTAPQGADQQWQSDAARNPDLERVRNVLLGRYRGSRPERVSLFLLDLRASFEANNVCPTTYGIPLPPERGTDPIAKETARWKHDPALATFNQSHSPRGRQADVVREVEAHLSSTTDCDTFKMVYVDGKAGTGKTTTLRFLLNKARLQGRVTLVAAPTNLAALLYSGGQSCHALFELLVTRDRGEVVTSRIRAKSDKAQLLEAASIIVIDELPSMKRADFEAMLQLLDEVRFRESTKSYRPCQHTTPHQPIRFGQVGFRGALVAAGDFRQIGPVVRDANSVQQIQASPRLSQAWPYFKQIHLDAPQRTRDDPEYDAHITNLGDGASPVVGFSRDDRPVVDVSFITNRFDRTSRPDALRFTFDSECDPSRCAVLAPTNVLVDAWNEAVQARGGSPAPSCFDPTYSNRPLFCSFVFSRA